MSRRYHFGSIIDGLEIGGGRGILCEGLWLVLSFVVTSSCSANRTCSDHVAPFLSFLFLSHYSTFHCHINKIFNCSNSGMPMAISKSPSFHAYG
ncbi:hypothetical protein T06_13272 [Trichinella sp. T6]|nr:hypothetical protein T06_13272 [Trichinella sp. T6]